MATGFIDPDGDSSTGWTTTEPTGGTHFSKIDDAVRQPTASNRTDYIASGAGNGTNREDVFTMATIASVGSVSAVKIWVDVSHSPGTPFPGNLKIDIAPGGGAYVGLQTVIHSGGFGWESVTFSGLSWNQTQLDGMLVKIRHEGGGFKAPDLWQVSEVYAEVTYTAGAGETSAPPDTTRGFFDLL